MNLHALVIEPDAAQRRIVRDTLDRDGWRVAEARSAEEAVGAIESCPWSLIFCDMSERDQGLTLLRDLKAKLGDAVPVVMIAAHVSPHTVLEAIFNGALDLITKPCREQEVRERSRSVIERLQAAARETGCCREDETVVAATPALTDFEIIGRSGAIRKVTAALAKALKNDHDKASAHAGRNGVKRPPTFFITGETGTGKELLARLIHRHSRYAAGPFVAVNCSNLPAELADAELFGSAPGAFTGALKHEQPGIWEAADQGTLFLDEITEAPALVLPKLLRVLQSGEFKRLGSRRSISVDAQVIAASNRDVAAEIEAGRFREDLYHRLSLHKLRLPPLRERAEDIPLLVEYFARRYSPQPMRFSRDALDLLQRHRWPGNIRELENVVRAAVTCSLDGAVYVMDLLPRIEAGTKVTAESLEEKVKEFKLRLVKEALEKHHGNVTRAASALGITRPSLYKMLKELNNENLP